MAIVVPSWLRVVEGSAPLLLVAPHAGRRRDLRIPGRHKVNDLMTAEVTRALAAATAASAIVNEHLDRNTLDLNRVTQLRRDAPWMIDLIAEMLEGMVATHGHAIVLTIHGWNVTQPVCDVGIGMREHGDALVPVRPETITVSDAFLTSHVRALQALAADADLHVTIGSRYPAAHANNALQLFRAAPDHGDAFCPLAALCRRVRIEAVQLELAIPLRWPGPRRDRFVALLAKVFGADFVARAPVRRASTRPLRTVGGRVTERRGLQCVADQTLVMIGIDAADDGPVAGRIVISRWRDDLILFTGELSHPDDHASVPPLAITPVADDMFRVTYYGPLMRFPVLTPFLDLERGLAAGTLVEGRIDLVFTADRGGVRGFGHVQGDVEIDGHRQAIDVRGATTHRAQTFMAQQFPHCRLTLPEGPWGPSSWSRDRERPLVVGADGSVTGALRGEVASVDGVRTTHADIEIVRTTTGDTLRLRIDDDAAGPTTVVASVERAIPVRRPGRDGAVVETTFALVRAQGRYLGWFEMSIERAATALDVT